MFSNSKTGKQLDTYFRSKYAFQIYESQKFISIVEANIMKNTFSREKLPFGTIPHIKSYIVGNVLVGIDITSGEFHVKSKEIENSVFIYDDLIVYRGLDENDLKNFMMVGQYEEIIQKSQANS